MFIRAYQGLLDFISVSEGVLGFRASCLGFC